MSYNPDIHHRKSIRLKNYDYSQEALYFITICTEGKKHILGRVVGGGDLDALRALLKAGADTEYRDHNGDRALL